MKTIEEIVAQIIATTEVDMTIHENTIRQWNEQTYITSEDITSLEKRFKNKREETKRQAVIDIEKVIVERIKEAKRHFVETLGDLEEHIINIAHQIDLENGDAIDKVIGESLHENETHL